MGFYQASTTKDTPAIVLTPGFEAHCTLPIIGLVQTFVNDTQKPVFTLKNVSLFGLEVGNPAVSMRVPELYVRKDECHLLGFEQMFSHEETGLMARGERLAVYTSHFAIQADFHMGADALLTDFIATSNAQFMAATDVEIFPLFQAQSAFVQRLPLAYVHQSVIKMHHRV